MISSSGSAPSSELTKDHFFNGRLKVLQYRDGYRFSIDAAVLAALARPRPGDAVVDLGTGCGIIPLMLVHQRPDIRVAAVEIQPELAELARRNAMENRMADAIAIHCADMRTLTPAAVGAPVDLVVSNPPFREGRSGRVNPNPQRAMARHEIAIDLPGLIAAGRRLLRTGGRMAVIYPARRLAELLGAMTAAGIVPKYLRMIHSDADADARRAVVAGVMAGRPGLRVAPPLFIRQASIPKASIPQNGIPQNGIPQNGIPQNGILQNGILQNGIPQNSIRQNGVRQNDAGPGPESGREDGPMSGYTAEVRRMLEGEAGPL